jgi:nicotinamidase-related amidase
VVICGIEAHVCVLQTVLDLISLGYRVFVAVDAVGSRNETDATIARERMSLAGAVMTTVESVLFEWCEVAGGDQFKQLSRMIKENS